MKPVQSGLLSTNPTHPYDDPASKRVSSRQSHSGTDYHRPMSQPSDISDKLSHPSVDSLEGHWCNLLDSLSRVYPSISDPIADCLGSLSSGFGIQSADIEAGLRRARKVGQVAMTSASRISSLRSTGGMNNEFGSGGSGDNGRGGSGGDGSGNVAGMGGGNGDKALNLPMAALKPGGARTWLGLPYGRGNLRSGDDGSAGAVKHRARHFSAVGGDNEMSGDGGGVGR
ncbi:hypothetical protein Tco_1382753 [Tanacetum coccineum]